MSGDCFSRGDCPDNGIRHDAGAVLANASGRSGNARAVTCHAREINAESGQLRA